MATFDINAYDEVAFDAENDVSASAGAATGAGAAAAAIPAVTVNAGLASGAGAAYSATTVEPVLVNAGVATGSGAAYGATIASQSNVTVNAGVARGYGRAYDATTTGAVPAVEIMVAGIEYGPLVHFPTIRLESRANGQPGRGYMRLRDDDRTLSFTGGEEVVVRVNGENVWRGFVTQGKRVYIAPALNVAESGLTRWYDLEMTDINILFSKRFVYDQADPENGYSTLFPPGTADTTALADMFADFIDLSGDGLDTSSLIDNVADINVDQSARGWRNSSSWAQAMQLLNALPNAVWYIDPDKNVVWADVDQPNAPFALSDVPNGTTIRGYREMEVLKDGTNLANDVMCWGIGYGSQTPVFVRDQDATSIAEHGVWQLGKLIPGVYKQATINKNAQSIIDGSPSSKRGSKNDRVSASCTTYESGLRVAQKVDFTSEVFGFNDVIPIRRMIITFEAPDHPRYDLFLSHEIDPPWSLIDPFFLRLLDLWPPPPPPPPPPSPPIFQCAIFDDFNRVVVGDGWGTASSGYEWGDSSAPPSAFSYTEVDGTSAHTFWAAGDESHFFAYDDFVLSIIGTIPTPWNTPPPAWTTTIKWRFDVMASIPNLGGGSPVAGIELQTNGLVDGEAHDMRCLVSITDTALYNPELFVIYTHEVGGDVVTDVDGVVISVSVDTDYYVKWGYTSGQQFAKIWEVGDTEPDWMVSIGAPPVLSTLENFFIRQNYKDLDDFFPFEAWRERNQWIDFIDVCAPAPVPGSIDGRVCMDFTGDGVTTDFTVNPTMGYSTWELWKNGEFQLYTTDYTILSSAEFRMISAPDVGDALHICYVPGFFLLSSG